MISPPVFLVSTSWNSNQKLQQATTTSSNINIPPASAVVAGEGNLLQYGQAMAAEALTEGGGSRDGSAPAAQANAQLRSMSERSKLLGIPKPEPGLRCPRCDSTSTKFCYFNNYSFAQPRHFCRNCHRYWTRGGALRDIPVGAPCRRRRAKGSKPSAAATAGSASSAALAMTSSCTTNVVALAPTPQQATASSSVSPVLPQLYGLASMDTPNVGSNFSWPGAANLLVDSAGGRAVSESKMEQQRGALSQSSQMHRLPVFSHAIDQQQGPAVAVPVTLATPPSMFHPGLWNGGDGGICSGGEGQFHMITNRDEECPIWAMQADVNGYTTSYDPVPVIPQLQQATTTSSNINIPPASAVVAGEGNLLQYGQAMATEALTEGGGSRDGSAQAAQANAQPTSMFERSKLLRIAKPEPGLRCPRCDSTSTKFCYFNNYSFAQPRHFCRNCHRYWTCGGALRDIPVGTMYRRRRAKGSKPSAAATAASASSAALAITSSCSANVIALTPTPQQATASSSASPLLPQLYGLASMDTPNVGSNFSWPGAANLLVDSAGGRAVSESKMEQQRGALSQSSEMHRLPVFSHAIDQQQGPAVAVPVTMAMPPSMFHPGSVPYDHESR